MKKTILLTDENMPIIGGAVQKYFDDHDIKLSLPYDQLFIEFDDDCKVVGAAALKTVTFFEPLISDTPQTAVKLANMIEGVAIASGLRGLRCLTTEDKKESFEKYGFEQIQEDKILMEKPLWANLQVKKKPSESVEKSENSQQDSAD